MESDSQPPPKPAGGTSNLVYAGVGVAFFIAAIAVWFGMQSCEEPPATPAAMPDAGAPVERSTALADDSLILPDDVPDAGPQHDAGPPRIRYVTRYVGGGGGGFNCSGTINTSAARAALAENNLQFRNCYERRLKVNNQLEGRVTVQIRIGTGGSVTGVQTGGSMRDGQVLSCVRGVAQRIRFPQPTGGCAVVEQPFNFTPRN